MGRNKIIETVWCDSCGVDILWGPLIVDKRDYCCQGCSDGLFCGCGERMEMDEYRRGCGAESWAAEWENP